MALNEKVGAGMREYVKQAFLYPWNLLLFVGGAALAAMSPQPDAFVPIVMGLEIAYLTGLTAIPRFRTAIDAKMAARARGGSSEAMPSAGSQQSLERILESLPAPALPTRRSEATPSSATAARRSRSAMPAARRSSPPRRGAGR